MDNRDFLMRKSFLAAVLGFVTAIAFCGPVDAQEKTEEQLRKEYEGVPWDEAHTVESQHYTIRCNSTKEVARRYSEVMEKLLELYNKTFPDVYTKKMKWEVWVYKTRRQFKELHPKRAAATAGYYSASDRRVYTYHGLFGISGSTFNILAHEGMHAFQHSFLKSYYDTPTWLLEGMAVLFEGIEVTADGELLLKEPPRDRIVQVKVELKDHKEMKLADIVGDKAEPLTRRSYAYAGLFVWWLAKSGARQRKVLDELLAILGTRAYQKSELENLLRSHLGKSLEGVEKDWHAWIRKEKVEYTGRKMPGGSYSSRLLRFSMKRPASDWVMDADKAPVDGECVVFKRPRTDGRVSVTVFVNQLPLYADEIYIQWLDDLADSVKDLKIEEKERLKLKGRPGFRIIYTGSEPGSGVTTEPQKVELAAAVTAQRIYILRMQSAPSKWESNRGDFTRALEKLKLQ